LYYGDIAGCAAEALAAMIAHEKREAVRNEIKAVIERADLGQFCLASRSAPGAPEIFNPRRVGDVGTMRALIMSSRSKYRSLWMHRNSTGLRFVRSP
jgi:hypothetical protein